MHIDLDNLDMLKEIIGDDLKEVLNVFLDSTPDSILQLQNAIDSNTMPKIQSLAHAIKGSAANIGANQLSILAGQIEQQAKLNNSANFAELLPQVISENRAVEEALKTYMANF
ncbi:Hpt domain-containing protein [Thiomicrorhabdus sp. Kp2]|uniref:Hpt domain-containing protein n=1 Tax=Thiomicrorhabdus sp. Kp2 TaxID=1123518 RepID=UPI00040088C6|nr:Hpt domain-containing protein [Thiomicrorhabdus sp. Kp2]